MRKDKNLLDIEEDNQSKKLDQAVWRKVWKEASPFRRDLAFVVFLMMGVAGIDTVFPLMTLYAIDNYVIPGKMESLTNFAIIYLSLVAIQAVQIFIFIRLAGKVEVGMSYNIRKACFAKLQALSFSYFDRTPIGWIMARMTSDCERLGFTIAWGVVDLIWGLGSMFLIAAVMLYLNTSLALLVLTVVPLLAWVSHKFQVLILKSFRKVRQTNSQITSSFNEGIMGVEATKTLVREKANQGEFEGLTGTMFRSSFLAAVQSSLYRPIVQVIGMVGCALAVWAGGDGVITGAITYGVLVAFIAYTKYFFEPLHELARIFSELQNAQAAAERIFGLLETEIEILDNSSQEKTSLSSEYLLEGKIEFVDVDFSYQKGESIFRKFNLEVPAGQTLALVGETGSGKTTLTSLVCRFYEPTHGKIFIDGKDYREIPLQELQSNIGVVLQKPHLFSGTIAENIRYGKLDATQEEIEEVSRIVFAHDFIEKLDKGYNTEVGEGGSSLSTGQKQLISFARAILSDPKILIMDEATSSVDLYTEQMIQKAIRRILKGRTAFIIAHRLSTIKSANRILVIDQGDILEEGTHEELLEQEGQYHALCQEQFSYELALS